MLVPPVRDVDPSCEPHVTLLKRVLDEFLERRSASSLPDPPRVQPDRHHAGVGRSFIPQVIESTPAIIKEGGRIGVALRQYVPNIVVCQRVGDNEVTLAFDLNVVGQIVVIGVRVVDEAALFDEQFARVDGGAVPTVPSSRSLAAGLLHGLYRGLHVSLFLFSRELPDLLPAPAVATRLMAGSLQPLADLRIAFKGHRATKECALDVELIE